MILPPRGHNRHLDGPGPVCVANQVAASMGPRHLSRGYSVGSVFHASKPYKFSTIKRRRCNRTHPKKGAGGMRKRNAIKERPSRSRILFRPVRSYTASERPYTASVEGGWYKILPPRGHNRHLDGPGPVCVANQVAASTGPRHLSRGYKNPRNSRLRKGFNWAPESRVKVKALLVNRAWCKKAGVRTVRPQNVGCISRLQDGKGQKHP